AGARPRPAGHRPPGSAPSPRGPRPSGCGELSRGLTRKRVFSRMRDLSRRIVLLPGDGIGPEVIGAAAKILGDCAAEFGHRLDLVEYPTGVKALDDCGTPLPQKTLEACRAADAILLGAVGGPRWDSLPLGRRPESGLLELRKALELYVNLRPTRLREPLKGISPLKHSRAQDIDFEIVRELAGGIYFGGH